MVKDTRSSARTKSEENNNSKAKQNSNKGMKKMGSTTSETSVLRRSARETLLKKKVVTPPSSSKKSEGLEKQARSTPRDKRKSSTTEKQNVASPLRRSERGKKQSPSTSTGSRISDKSLGVSNMKGTKERKEKSVKQLTLATKEVGKSGKQGTVSEQAKSKRMDARAYRALFREKRRKTNLSERKEQHNIPDRGTQGGSRSCRENLNGSNKYDEEDNKLKSNCLPESSSRALEESLNRAVEEASDRSLEESNDFRSKIHEEAVYNDTVLVSRSRRASEEAPAELLNDNGEKIDAYTSANGEAETLEKTNSMLGVRRANECMNSDDDCKLISLKRKRSSVDLDSNASTLIESKNTCSLIVEAIPPLQSSCRQSDVIETCGICLKGKRVDNDSVKDFCSCVEVDQRYHETSIDMDRGNSSANVITNFAENCDLGNLKKASPVNLPAEVDPNTCLVCKQGGKLLCCEGKDCRRSFHLSCLDPPLHNVPLGVWHCPMCIRRKFKVGVHAVSKGVESIWDVREVEISGSDGLQRQKQYFVKFKDLGHVHNRWIPESELLLEASSIVSRFNKRNQFVKWRQEWAVPQRLLQKRLLVSPKICQEHEWVVDGVDLSCQCEWLVKWRGLDYNQATWELGNSLFLSSLAGQGLIKDYESRCLKAKLASHGSEVDTILEKKRNSVVKPSLFMAMDMCGSDKSYLNYVNKLRKFWHDGKNAIVLDNQDRMGKVVAFTLSLQPHVFRPFLIISTSAALDLWDHEFLRHAPSFCSVVYKGNKNIRNNIRDLEFYEGKCPMFQALICTPEVMMEDLDVLGSIKWEVIIVDECQRPMISSHFEQIKMVNADMRLLVLAGQQKDISDDCHDLLSLLEPDDNDNISTFKDRLLRHIAYACTSRFVEYWVPAQISNVQLEQYCATLLSNSALLCSSFKNDLLDNIHNLLILIRKCCNHPYIVEPSIGPLLTKGLQEVEYLDVGVKASGKLQLLEAMLMEMKKKDSRVLILFQSISGSGRDSIGDILDDFVRQRFGPDSYERIDGGLLIYSKKQAALNRFNTESGRFLFLLEVRACLPSIKLSSIDSIIIYDSDWFPMNDLRALQRISLDSQLEQIKIFRLYTSCTLEEKVLMLSMQNKTLDGNLQNISWNCANMLLMWGASSLFDNLEKFHDENRTADTSSEQSLLQEVVQDLVLLISQNSGSTNEYDSRVILKVQQIEGVYSAHSPLLGELKMPSLEEIYPVIFWPKLLDGQCPKWKYSSDKSLRNRKRVKHSEQLSQKSVVESEESARKRKKLTNSSSKVARQGNLAKQDEGSLEAPIYTRQNSTRTTACKSDPHFENHASTLSLAANDILKILKYKSVDSNGVKKLCDVRKSLHCLLKPELSKLCKILELPVDLQRKVEMFYEYIMGNHHVITEPATPTLLQAFQLSLCWTAASLVEYKIDHKESFLLAKKHLNFDCSRQELYLLYSRLRCLKKILSSHLEINKNSESSLAFESFNIVLSGDQFEKTVVESINKIQINCRKKIEKLKQKQQKEKDEFDRTCEKENSQIEKRFRMESVMIRSFLHSNILMRKNKLEILENEYAKKREEHKFQMEIRCKKLEEEHSDERNKMVEKEGHWVDTLTSWLQIELLNKQIIEKSGHERNSLLMSGQLHGLKNDTTVCDPLPEEGQSKVLHNFSRSREGEAEDCSNAAEKCSLQTRENGEYTALDTLGFETPIATEFEDRTRMNSLNDFQENITSENPVPSEKEPNGTILNHPNREVSAEGPSNRSSVSGLVIDSVHLPTSEVEISRFDKEFHQRLTESCDSIEGSETVLAVCLSPFAERMGDGTIMNPASEVPSGMHDAINSSPCVDVVCSTLETSACGLTVPIEENERRFSESVNPAEPASKELIHSGSMLSTPDVEISSMLSTPDVEISSRTHEGAACETSSGTHEGAACEASSGTHEGAACEASLGTYEGAACEALTDDSIDRQDDGKDSSETVNPCLVDHQDATNNTNLEVNANVPSVNIPSVQLAVTSTQGHDTLLFDQVQDSDAPVQNTLGNIEAPISHLVDQSFESAQLTEPQTQMVPLLATDSSIGCSDLASAGGMEDHVDRENHPADPLARTEMQPVENPIEPIDEVLSETATCTAPDSNPNVNFSDTRTSFGDTRTVPANLDISNGLWQPTQPILSLIPPAPYMDPLQIELERMHKEIDQVVDKHAQMKLQLKSECEKEIEEVSAQIRKKYETKLQDSETEFDAKKKELDVNYNKVLMNKILADAFRLKNNDTGPSDTSSSQMIQPLLQNIPGPSLFVSPPVVCPSAVIQHTPNAPSINMQRITTTANVPTCSPASTQSVGPPSIHTAHHSSTHFSSNPMRPLHISSISSTTGNRQTGSIVRAPAPHLQPFRPSSSISVTNPHGISGPHGTSNPSPSLSQLPPRLPTAPHQTVPLNRAYRPESLGQLPTVSNTSLSAVDLLMDMNSRAGVNFPVNMPPLPDLSPIPHQPAPPVRLGGLDSAEPDVVCLSDDD